MSITKNLFGTLEDGRAVYAYTLMNANGMRVVILDRGGVICQLYAPDKKGRMVDVVGGYDNLDYYVNASGYQGALIGRFGNRIANAKFTLDGKEYPLFANNNGNHLHGGEFGFGAEIGISTQKLHVRGPMGLPALTTEKYLIRGNGAVR